MNKEIKTLAVHSGKFHSDDVLAAAILKLIYPDVKIIRTRDPEVFDKVDLRVDVGGKYDVSTGDFDHHQAEFNEKRENGIPYSSVGLIWKHFGMKIAKTDYVWKMIDEKIIQPVDMEDNGIGSSNKFGVLPYTFGWAINSFNNLEDGSFDPDRSFDFVVNFVMGVLKREIAIAKDTECAEKILLNKIKDSAEEYLVLEKHIPWKKTIVENSKIKLMVYPTEMGWSVYSVPDAVGSFGRRKDLPKKWAGLKSIELQEVTGIRDAIFCHKGLFCAVAKSKEGAIKMAELALKDEE